MSHAMRNLTKYVLVTAFTICFAAANASVKTGHIVYRDISGELTDASVDAAKKIQRKARKQGFVTLWITIDYPVNLDLGPDDTAAISEQRKAIANAFETVLSPMIEKGIVWHPPDGPHIQGPGCTVRADRRGFRKLVREKRIIQIVDMGESTE